MTMMSPEFKKKFFEKTEDTGRHVVISFRTGKTYAIEPMGKPHTNWGDLNPATGKVEGSYGEKYRGSIDEKDSLVTEENGFKNITILKPGMSPAAYIEEQDAQYPDKE
jgi:hypothetical protein